MPHGRVISKVLSPKKKGRHSIKLFVISFTLGNGMNSRICLYSFHGTFDLNFGIVNNVAESKAVLISFNRIAIDRPRRLLTCDMKMINPQIPNVCLRK